MGAVCGGSVSVGDMCGGVLLCVDSVCVYYLLVLLVSVRRLRVDVGLCVGGI